MGVVVAPANVHDSKLLEATIQAIVVARPDLDGPEQNLCLDNGYAGQAVQQVTAGHDYEPHVRPIREEKPKAASRRHPPRRWVVERTLGWLSKCRAILVRYAKKSCNYLGLIQLACILLWYRRCHRLGVLG